MFDLGSYRSAIDILEDPNDSYPKPPSYSRVTQSSSHPMNRGSRDPRYHSQQELDSDRMSGLRGSRYHSQQELDSDWVSVPINGERHQNMDSGRRSVPTGASNHQRMGYRNTSRVLDDDDDHWTTNGSNTVGSRKQVRSNRDMETVRVNGSSGRSNDLYPDHRTYKTTSRTVYNDGMERQYHERPMRSQASSILPTSRAENTGRQSSGRLIYNGADTSRETRSAGVSKRAAPEEKRFLNDVQKELEFQRQNWKGEIEKMSGNMLSGTTSSTMATKSSYVDTSSGEPRFKAFIDVSEFPPSSVTVNVDKLSSKIVVEAKQVSGVGTVAKTFTQKVQLPRFADETRLSARMNRDGVLKVEVPLIYYFPEEDRADRKAKSFVGGVHNNPDGSKTMEILVRPGQDVSLQEIRVEVTDDKLVIFAEKTNKAGASQKIIVKKYTLPENADIQGISSSRTGDGCLTIFVPLY